MSSRYGGRGYGRYGDPEEDRTDERFYERGSEYGGLRRGGYAGGRGGYEREYGRERDYDARDSGPREYGSRYGREVFERGGYAGSASRRYEGEEYGRPYRPRAHGRDYERRVERPYRRHDDDADEVRDYDTDYGRTTSRFYGRSGYEYGRDDYDERGDYGRRSHEGHRDEREGGSWLDRAADQVRSWFGGDDDDRERGRHGDESRRMYGRGEGKFRGRGPKNYRRSDDRLREEVCDRLTDNEWLDASDVEVNVVAGEVILTGTVDSRYAKRLAEEICESATGVSNVQNNLRVRSRQAADFDSNVAAGAAGATGGMTGPLGDVPMLAGASDTTATADPGATATTDAPDVPPTGRSSRAAGRS
jgi:osmotically-inducible protein OsmY